MVLSNVSFVCCDGIRCGWNYCLLGFGVKEKVALWTNVAIRGKKLGMTWQRQRFGSMCAE